MDCIDIKKKKKTASVQLKEHSELLNRNAVERNAKIFNTFQNNNNITVGIEKSLNRNAFDKNISYL